MGAETSKRQAERLWERSGNTRQRKQTFDGYRRLRLRGTEQSIWEEKMVDGRRLELPTSALRTRR